MIEVYHYDSPDGIVVAEDRVVEVISGAEGPVGPRGLQGDTGEQGPVGPSSPLQIGVTVQGPTNLTDTVEPLFTWICGAEPVVFAASLLRGTARVAALADTAFPLVVNGSQVGAITYTAAQTTPSMTPAEIELSDGDVFQCFGPATPDDALRSPAFVLQEALP